MSNHNLSEQAAVVNDSDFITVVKMSLNNKISEVLQDPTSNEQDKRTAVNASSQMKRIINDVVAWCAGADLSANSTDEEIDDQIDILFSSNLAYRVGTL